MPATPPPASETVALLQETFPGREVLTPDPSEPINYQVRNAYRVPVDSVEMAHRALADLRQVYTKYGIDTSANANYQPVQFDGQVCVHQDIAAHPRFREAMQDSDFRVNVRDSTQSRPIDQEYDAAMRDSHTTDPAAMLDAMLRVKGMRDNGNVVDSLPAEERAALSPAALDKLLDPAAAKTDEAITPSATPADRLDGQLEDIKTRLTEALAHPVNKNDLTPEQREERQIQNMGLNAILKAEHTESIQPPSRGRGGEGRGGRG